MPCSESQGEKDWFDNLHGTSNPDKLRDMLCRMINFALLADEPISLKELPVDIQEWWRKHREWDKKRKLREETK